MGVCVKYCGALCSRACCDFFRPPPLMGGMVLATSKKIKDRKFPVGIFLQTLLFYQLDQIPFYSKGFGLTSIRFFL